MKRDIGVNTWVWCSPPTDEILSTLIPRVAQWGFDVIELPVEDRGQWSPDHVRGLLDTHGLGATVCLVMPPGRELVVTDDATVASTQEYLRHVIDVAAAIGSDVIGGPAYSSVGRTWLLSPDERLHAYDELATNLAPIGRYASNAGVRVAIEPLNRFETSLINTVDQALEIIRRVDNAAVGLAFDTFHAAIEERDMAAGLIAAGRHLHHVQVCGSDRGSPGGDNVNWRALIEALDQVDFAGPLCIESFTSENETIAKAAAIWRPLVPSQDQLATDGLAFLRQLMAD